MSTEAESYGTLITFASERRVVMTLDTYQPILATPNPLLISGVREVVALAGISLELQVIAPAGIGLKLLEGPCLAILDGQALPPRDALAAWCAGASQSRLVLWATRPTADLLKIALECGVHGLLSAGLPASEAAVALVRICAGERILRFDPDEGLMPAARPVQFSLREQQLLRELAAGANNARIAAALQTSPSSIKGNLSRLFHKTGTRNRRELAELTQSLIPAVEPPAGPPPASPVDASAIDAPPASPVDRPWMFESL